MADRTIRVVLTVDSLGAVKGFDAVTVAAEETAAATDKAQASISRSVSSLGQRLSGLKSVGSQLKSTGQAMTSLAVPILAVGGYSIYAASQFGKSMMLMRTQVGLTAQQTGQFQKQILAMAGTVGQSPDALAQALYPIVSVGLRGSQALDALKAAAQGADVSGANLADTADVIAGALRTQMRDVTSASQAMAILNATVTEGKMHLQDLVGAISTGILPEAKNFGLGLKDIGVALAALTREGIPAETAATRMRLALTKMAAPTGATLKAFEAMGLSQQTLANDMREHGLLAALVDLESHLSKFSPNARNILLAEAFGGSRSSATVMSMLNAIPSMQQIAPKIMGAGAGALQSGMQVWGHTISGEFAKAIASIQSSIIGLGQALAPMVAQWLPKLVSLISGAVRWFAGLPHPIQEVVMYLTAFLAIGGPIIWMVGTLITAVSALGGVLTFLGGALDFLAANPAVLVVAALVAIGVAVYKLTDNGRLLGQALTAVWHAISSGATAAANWIVGAFQTVSTFFTQTIPNAISSAFSSVLLFVEGIARDIVNALVDGVNFVIGVLDWLIRRYNDVVGSIPFVGGDLTIGQIGRVGHVTWGNSTAQSQPGGFHLSDLGSQRNNSTSQTGHVQGGGHQGAPIVLHHTTKIGNRVVAEETVHYAQRRTSLGGAVAVGAG